MSKLKKFLDKRSEGLAKKAGIKDAVSKDEITEDDDLTDEEFWEISNTYLRERRNSEEDPVIILQEILRRYSPKKIKQFAKRFEELNS